MDRVQWLFPLIPRTLVLNIPYLIKEMKAVLMQQMKIPIQINAPRFLMKKNTSLQLKSTQHPDIQISTELPVAKQSRPPHSKTCGHRTKGHANYSYREKVFTVPESTVFIC